MKAILLRNTQQRQNKMSFAAFCNFKFIIKQLKKGFTREMFFNTRREILRLCAAMKYPLFIPRVIKD